MSVDIQYSSSLQCEMGILNIYAVEQGITEIKLTKSGEAIVENNHAIIDEAKKQLIAYFQKQLKTFDLPVYFDEEKYGNFMVSVWKALQQIPYGKTISYLDLARQVATDKHTRAVGMANGKNPIPIVVPCHRVIGSNGSLTGFALGIDVKKKLLELEQGEKVGIQSSLF